MLYQCCINAITMQYQYSINVEIKFEIYKSYKIEILAGNSIKYDKMSLLFNIH